jgi:hypothetical protein
MKETNEQYRSVMARCEEVFRKKTQDYGTAWRVLRTISIIDQIYIKAYRIRTIQEKGDQKIADDIAQEFIGIINYSIIGLIQLLLTESDPEEMDIEKAVKLFHSNYLAAYTLMQSKNHDYGEAWRTMSEESLVDLILMKLQRMKQIESNNGKTVASEGLDANYFDMINYATFALIILRETLI